MGKLYKGKERQIMFQNIKDVTEISRNRFADSPLGRQATILENLPLNNFEVDKSLGMIDKIYNKQIDCNDSPEKRNPIQNKIDGLQRETEVKKELEKKYPPEQGYTILSEVYLRDENGKIAKDPQTGKARRIDFVVVKDGTVIESIEVTSQTADKHNQLAKENRIRNDGGSYIRDNNGELIKVPESVQTNVERRD